MPSTYAWPVVAMKVTALAWVAMMERPMAYQGMVLPASRYWLTVLLPRPFQRPKLGMAMMVRTMTIQSSGVIGRPFKRSIG